MEEIGAAPGAGAERARPRQHPAGRVGTPHDIAALILFLLSPDSGFITGANFTVDGGHDEKDDL